MAQGQKTDNETIYKIMATYFIKGSYAEVGRILSIPPTTVEKIVKENKDKPEFVELCAEKRKSFSKDFENIISKAVKRLNDELDTQDNIPINHLSTVIGTIYDKNRLENDESTSNENQTINIAFSEDIEELSK